MRGFTDKALILLPDYPIYTEKPEGWKLKLTTSLNNLCAYLDSVEVAQHFLYTDDTARVYRRRITNWVCSLSKADLFFVSKHCDDMQDAMSLRMIEFPDLYMDIARKDMVDAKATEAERFNMVVRHNNAANKEIYSKYKVIFAYTKKNKQTWRVHSKDGDGMIRVYIDPDTFIPECYMSGSAIDMCDALGVDYANRALTLWEV